MKKLYVSCTHDTVVKAKTADRSEYAFYPFILNKYTGQPEHTGFTEVSEEVVADLRENSRVFQAFEARGLLVVSESIPDSHKTPFDILSEKDARIAELTAKVAALEKENAELIRWRPEPTVAAAMEASTGSAPSVGTMNGSPPNADIGAITFDKEAHPDDSDTFDEPEQVNTGTDGAVAKTLKKSKEKSVRF